MALASAPSSATVRKDDGQNYTTALSSLTVLFFMMGFITCLNDILIPYLKAAFALSFVQGNLINFCFFRCLLRDGHPGR